MEAKTNKGESWGIQAQEAMCITYASFLRQAAFIYAWTKMGDDFSADNPMKENARRMMRMTIEINKKKFNFDTTTKRPGYLLNVVTCNTCHRGNPYPAHE